MMQLTLAVTKSALKLSRLLGRGGGTALPGLIAERMDPKLGFKLAKQLPNGVILVTGTNGKTTTTKLIAAALVASGERVLTNRAGSNLKRGIVSTLINAADRRGKIDATIGLFEVDEASIRLVAPDLKPKQILVLNLFRDQLDRYGELDTTARLIGEGIAGTDAHIYLNADDPLVASLAKYSKRPELVSYFGIEGLPASAGSHPTAIDSDRCPACGERLNFTRIFYGHIGHYSCPNGDFNRPQPTTAITNVDKADLQGTNFTVSLGGKRHDFSVALPGTYNLYNALAALALGNGIGLSTEHMRETLVGTAAAFGRVEKIVLGGKTLYLLLIKNPAGFTQVMDTFLLTGTNSPVLMVINDLAADGRDVSWLWDVPFEAMAAANPVVITSGLRGPDMSLRLKYAGIPSSIEGKLEQALERLLELTPAGGTAFVLPTYTAMLDLRKLIGRQTELEEVWR